ncbi:hypothetical protein NC652_023410 [Populus alba x Populus x berolinensis]|nr:hypothetical protein NC652_023410 [Populus alba x Populus x berolinensis]
MENFQQIWEFYFHSAHLLMLSSLKQVGIAYRVWTS